MPKVINLVEFSTSWWSWWRTLQPEWRLLSDGTLSREVPGTNKDWEKICRGGCNGFFVVIMTLAWWVTAVDGKADDEDLLRALGETTWVMDCMIQSLGEARKQKHGLDKENIDSEVPAKKR